MGGRFPIFLDNLPETIPAKFVDQQCGSAMAAIQIGFMEIAQDYADVVMVGGYEHMTRIPHGWIYHGKRADCTEHDALSLSRFSALGYDECHEHGDDGGKSCFPRQISAKRIWTNGRFVPTSWRPNFRKRGFSMGKLCPSKPPRTTEPS